MSCCREQQAAAGGYGFLSPVHSVVVVAINKRNAIIIALALSRIQESYNLLLCINASWLKTANTFRTNKSRRLVWPS